MPSSRHLPARLITGLTLLSALAFSASAGSLGTAFTYQGKLSSGTNAANGAYDLTFSLFDASSGGLQVGSTLTNAATGVNNGLFTVALDFGSVFDGNARWLEIGVRTNGGGAFTTLTPRQALNPTPHALFAVNTAALGGQAPGAFAPASGSAAYVAKAGDTMTGKLNLPVNGLSVGSTQLVVNGGMVGIGKSAPLTVLDVADGSGTNHDGGNIHVGGFGLNGDPKLIQFGDLNFVYVGEKGQDDTMELRATRFYFNTGNVGIFKTNPATALDVVGTVTATGFSGPGTFLTGIPTTGLADNSVTAAKLASDANSLSKVSAGSMSLSGGALSLTVNEYLNDRDIYLRSDTFHGLGWSGAGKLFANRNDNGPALYGADGGVLGTTSGGQQWALSWNKDANVTAHGALSLDNGNANTGSVNRAALTFGAASGEGIASKRNAGGNQAGLDFYTAAQPRLSIDNAGRVGIGTTTPSDSHLDVRGDIRLNSTELLLLGGTDRYHGLGWYGFGKLFAGNNVNGPVLYGFDGGGLGAMSPSQQLVVQWNSAGNVYLDPAGINNGTLTPGLRFGASSQEGIASKRTAGGNQFGLDFYTFNTNRMSITQLGNVGIGKSNPTTALDVNGTVTATSFSGTFYGNGFGLSSVNADTLDGLHGRDYRDAGYLNAGTLSDARLSGNVALLSANQAFTGVNTFAGAVGIGTPTPFAALLDVEGDIRLNLHDLYLFPGNDTFHGLGFYGGTKPFAGVNVNGPVLYGNGGGALGSVGASSNIALRWDDSQNIFINGRVQMNNNDIQFHFDNNHGLGWYGIGKNFAGASPDGPVLYGYSGGGLGTFRSGSATNLALVWNNLGNVGIGKNNPSVALDVNGEVSAPTVTVTSQLRLTGPRTVLSGWDGSSSHWFGPSPDSDLAFGIRRAGVNDYDFTLKGRFYGVSFNMTSDRNAKENFQPVNPQTVLEKVAALPISEWNFKGDASTPHIGPMAQDFHAAFGVGPDDKHIATVDADGVALAAIQGLNQKLEAKNAALEKEVAELKALVQTLATKVNGGGQ